MISAMQIRANGCGRQRSTHPLAGNCRTDRDSSHPTAHGEDVEQLLGVPFGHRDAQLSRLFHIHD